MQYMLDLLLVSAGDSMIEAEVELAGLDDNEIDMTLQCDFEIYSFIVQDERVVRMEN